MGSAAIRGNMSFVRTEELANSTSVIGRNNIYIYVGTRIVVWLYAFLFKTHQRKNVLHKCPHSLLFICTAVYITVSGTYLVYR